MSSHDKLVALRIAVNRSGESIENLSRSLVTFQDRIVAGGAFRPSAVDEELRKLRLAKMKRMQREKLALDNNSE